MFLLISIVGIIVAFIALAVVLERRRKQQIADVIAAMGGKVLDIRYRGISDQRTARYVGPLGEWRQAQVTVGKPPVIREDVTYQEILRREYKKRPPKVMLDHLKMAAEVLPLPGYADYCVIFRNLANGRLKVERIEENSPNNMFAPVLQCLEVAALGSPDPHVLVMTADGVNVTVRWAVSGNAPQQVLILEKVAEIK